MSTIEHLETPISRRPRLNAATDLPGHKDEVIALRRRPAGSSFLSAMRLLPARRREAMRALYAFCREVDDIADGEASRSLKQTLLSNWRSEIGHLYAGRPQHAVTRGLSEAIHLYGLRCDDFLAIIDGMEMDARTDIRAPSFAELDRYCERVAVAVGRISVADLWRDVASGRAGCSRTRPGVAAHQHTSRSRRRCAATPALPASRAAARARHIRDHAELGAGTAGVARCLPGSGYAR
jgi:phytoene/squalene synthetase